MLDFVSKESIDDGERRRRYYWVHDRFLGPNKLLLYLLLFGHAI